MNREKALNIINENGILPDSKFGQNFLCDDNICHDIIALVNAKEDDSILEIGPGIGALTRILVNISDDVTAVEIDKRLAEILSNDTELSSLNLIVSDFLKLDSVIYNADKYSKVLSNIPYYIMTPIMVKLMSECTNCNSMAFMVEDAAVGRIIAKPGTKQYGPLSILVSLFGDVNKEFIVPSNCFIPAPHTTSAVISMYKNNNLVITTEFAEFLEASFMMRRKKLVNSLNSYCNSRNISNLKESLSALNLREDIRAENVTPMQFYELYNLIHE